MKRLNSIETDQVQLEVIQCDCGFHTGIDASYLDQEGDVKMICPVCKRIWSTADVCPADDGLDFLAGQTVKGQMEHFENQNGWNKTTQLLLCLEYIDLCQDGQAEDTTFLQYIKERSECS